MASSNDQNPSPTGYKSIEMHQVEEINANVECIKKEINAIIAQRNNYWCKIQTVLDFCNQNRSSDPKIRHIINILSEGFENDCSLQEKEPNDAGSQ